MRILEAYRDGQHIGQFVRTDNRIEFRYDSPDAAIPISLSLPPGTPHTRRAAERVLENLLPDNPAVREAWARTLEVPNTGFDLLERLGEDVAGALTIMPEGTSPDAAAAPVRPASDDEIADRILAIRQRPEAWMDPAHLGERRMSLAGAQGKFALARVRDQWFWSTAQFPSTHIVKPGHNDFSQVHELEAASLQLARHVGLSAPHAETLSILGQDAYLVERFDRTVRDDIVRRRHMEDFAQALGLSPQDKYRIQSKHILQLLAHHAPDERYRFVELMVFNTVIGNADAHGKNYSVFLDQDVSVAPLYDALPTTVWPHLRSELAMRIAGAAHAQEVTLHHWRKLARTNDLDQDRVVGIVERIASIVRSDGSEIYRSAGVRGHELDRIASVLDQNTNRFVGAQAPVSDA